MRIISAIHKEEVITAGFGQVTWNSYFQRHALVMGPDFPLPHHFLGWPKANKLPRNMASGRLGPDVPKLLHNLR